MKHDELRSIAHNIADSLAGGMGFLAGMYCTDIFAEAAQSKEGFIAVDFISGATEGAAPSASLAKAIMAYRGALPKLCEKHGVPASSFKALTARYSTDSASKLVLITIEDANGRVVTDEYFGLPLKRAKTLDERGRIRTKRIYP